MCPRSAPWMPCRVPGVFGQQRLQREIDVDHLMGREGLGDRLDLGESGRRGSPGRARRAASALIAQPRPRPIIASVNARYDRANSAISGSMRPQARPSDLLSDRTLRPILALHSGSNRSSARGTNAASELRGREAAGYAAWAGRGGGSDHIGRGSEYVRAGRPDRLGPAKARLVPLLPQMPLHRRQRAAEPAGQALQALVRDGRAAAEHLVMVDLAVPPRPPRPACRSPRARR